MKTLLIAVVVTAITGLAAPAQADYRHRGLEINIPIHSDGERRFSIRRLAGTYGGIDTRRYRITHAIVYAKSWGPGSWTGLRIGKRNTPEYHFAAGYSSYRKRGARHGFEPIRIDVHQKPSRHWDLRIGPNTTVRNIILHVVPRDSGYRHHHRTPALYLAPRLYWYDSSWHKGPRVHQHRRGLTHRAPVYRAPLPGLRRDERVERRHDRRADRHERRSDRRDDRHERRSDRRDDRHERRSERREERHERRDHRRDERSERRERDTSERGRRNDESRSEVQRGKHWRGDNPRDGVRREHLNRQHR
ncbi:MAG: hypothetical protein NXH85_02065 [Pseudomonadaceae bacterium]|nr:hypothetical protein [Pseudomonadaceae bacterium]